MVDAGTRHSRPATVALILAGQSSQTIAVSAIALFLPLIRSDVGLSYSQAGALAVASTATYAAMQIPTGYVADRFDPRNLFLVGAIGVGVLLFGFAVAPSFPWLLVDQAASGVFRALMFTPGMLLITSQFDSARHATAMGLYVASGFATSIALNALGPILVGPLGWRTLLIIFAAAGVVVGILFLRVPRSGRRAATVSPHTAGNALARLLRNRIMLLCNVIQFIRLAVVLAVRFWMPTYLVVDRHLSLPAAGLVVASAAAITAVANFVGGYVSDRLRRPLLIIGVSMAALAVTTAGIGLLPGDTVLLAAFAVQSLFIQSYFGPLFQIPLHRLGTQYRGSVTGIANFWANVGGLVATYVLGAVKQASGSFVLGFILLSGLCLVGMLAAMMLRPQLARPAAPGTAPP